MNAIDLLAAYGLRKRRGKYFVSKICGFIRDDADFEAKHPRDKYGQFASAQGVSGKVDVKASIAALREKLNAGQDKPVKIAQEGARLLRGIYKSNLPEMPGALVYVSGDFVEEARKYFPKVRPAERKELAEKMLFAYEHFDDLLKTGMRTPWTNREDHHPELDFCTVSKRYVYKGLSRRFTLDISRPTQKTDEITKAYNMSNASNKGFDYKALKMGFRKDSMPKMIEVVRLRIED